MAAASKMVELSKKASLIQCDRLELWIGHRSDRKGKVLSPGTPIFKETLLEIRSGEHLGLVGKAGSGKTSLLRLLNRLIEPTQGQLYYEGTPYAKIPISHLRRQILYVAQEPKLLQSTALASIVYGLKLHGIQNETRLKNWLDRLEISQTLLTKPEIELSPGQRKWISIARALVLETPVLLLDEPTAYLDPRMVDRLTEILQTYSDKTLIIASQDLNWLPRICPETLVISDRQLNRSADWTRISAQLRASQVSLNEDWD